MLYSEIYGSYFNVVAAVLDEATRQTLTDERLLEIVKEKAFAESVLTLPAALKNKWPLLTPDLTTPIRHTPAMPLTTLQKRWLKALLQDKRIGLFAPDISGLEVVEPLFDPEDIVRFDQYADGDPYENAHYVAVFRQVLSAIREHSKLKIEYLGHTGCHHWVECLPYRLEYSSKDDKFRVLTVGNRTSRTINLARIRSCETLEQADCSMQAEPQRRLVALTFLLTDERNALERALLHFSHFEKETVRLSEKEYQVTLRYEKDDETELLIRILSFGPMIRVTAPERVISLIRQRLQMQNSCGLGN